MDEKERRRDPDCSVPRPRGGTDMSEARKERPLVAVTGSQQPYIFDLPHLLSLPEGFEFRFRYRPKWIEPELLARIRSGPEAFSERTLIVVFHSQEMKRLWLLT